MRDRESKELRDERGRERRDERERAAMRVERETRVMKEVKPSGN